MGLHHRKSFGGPAIEHRTSHRRLHPEVVEHSQHEHCHGRIVDDLHDLGEECGAPVEE
jgi:hypothetical protein